MKHTRNNDALTVFLPERLDSTNAPAVWEAVNALLEAAATNHLTLNCKAMEYISSAGLRVVLRMKKTVNDTVLTEVSSQVWEILSITGFTELLEVHRPRRVVSISGSEIIGQGASGVVYRIDPDTVVKVYRNSSQVAEIDRERALSRAAFLAGVPTAIPYDVVKIQEGGCGSVFELVNAASLATQVIHGDLSLEQAASLSVGLLRQLHRTEADLKLMPSMKDRALGWIRALKPFVPAAQFEKLWALVDGVPDQTTLLHGDFHLKNITLQDGEALVLDLDTLSHGHPIFELVAMYNAYRGRGEVNPQIVEDFLGLPYSSAVTFWRRSLALYLGTEDSETLDRVERKVRLLATARLLRWHLLRGGEGTPEVTRRREIVTSLLDQVEDLTF